MHVFVKICLDELIFNIQDVIYGDGVQNKYLVKIFILVEINFCLFCLFVQRKKQEI